MSGTIIRNFIHNQHVYTHKIFCYEDDRVELIDESGLTLLTFDASMRIYDNDQVLIGHIKIKDKDNVRRWCFVPSGQKIVIWGDSVRFAESHIDLEVDVSKWYLTTQP
jgi:hypothetical protein